MAGRVRVEVAHALNNSNDQIFGVSEICSQALSQKLGTSEKSCHYWERESEMPFENYVATIYY